MKTYEKNMADTALVVKSLTVLDKIDGGGLKEIRNSVESVKRQTTAQAKQQEQYWKSLSDDGVITVIEKQTLYRETQNIARSYSAITQQAASLQITAALLADYNATYNALHNYLYTTLKVFDDMSSETVIDDRNTFNTYFSNYYFEENFVLIAITAGILDTLEFRVLESLSESGEEGETAIYRGGLYQYVNGAWKAVTTGAYKGPRTELPGGEEGAFFIVSESFTLTEGLIINGEELYVNGEALGITHTYIKGLIYYCQDGVWKPENDKTNWRYAAAFADVINITGELPQIFQDAIDDLQEQIDSNVQTLEEEIATKHGQYTIINGDIVLIDDAIQGIVDRADGVDDTLAEQAEDISGLDGRATNLETQMAGKISHLPVYLGTSTSGSSLNPQVGDFYLHIGSGTDYLKVKRCSAVSGGTVTWTVLDPDNQEYRNYYMIALEDILSSQNAGTGRFTQIFCQAFWAASATVTDLDVKTVFLRQNGAIQSANVVYDVQRAGLRIDSSGNIDANGDMHFGATSTKKVAIGVDLYNSQGQYTPDFNDYDIVIGGNCNIKGMTVINGTTNIGGATHINGRTIIEGDAHFSGDIDAGPLKLTSEQPAPSSITYASGAMVSPEMLQYLIGGTGTYRGYTFTSVSMSRTGSGNWGFRFRLSLYKLRESGRISDLVYYEDYVNSNKDYLVQLQDEMVYNWEIASDAKTFILEDLPTTRPSTPNCVYRDGDYLRIS